VLGEPSVLPTPVEDFVAPHEAAVELVPLNHVEPAAETPPPPAAVPTWIETEPAKARLLEVRSADPEPPPPPMPDVPTPPGWPPATQYSLFDPALKSPGVDQLVPEVRMIVVRASAFTTENPHAAAPIRQASTPRLLPRKGRPHLVLGEHGIDLIPEHSDVRPAVLGQRHDSRRHFLKGSGEADRVHPASGDFHPHGRTRDALHRMSAG